MRRLTLLGAGLTIASALACSPAGPSGTGTLNVRITDGPFSDAKAALVTFSDVSVHRDGGGWQAVPFAGAGVTSRTCDLKKLENNAQDILGVGVLPAGDYTQIRLRVQSATLHFDSPAAGLPCDAEIVPPDEGTPLEIPSGEVKLNRGFTLEADGTTTILLDFLGDQSIHVTGDGRYIMTPVIAIVSVTASAP